MVNGLPLSGKSQVVENFIREISPGGKIQARPSHGLSFHELFAVANSDNTIEYKITESEDCYFYAMQSAMRQIRRGGARLQYTKNEDGSPAKIFDDDSLNRHLVKTFEQLRDKQEETISDDYIFGVALFNIWDIGYSRTIHHFLSPLHHLLSNSYSWLFFDLERDSKDAFKPPEVQNGENLMKWHPRVHYLIRAAKFSESQKNACSLFATHDGKLSENELREKISLIKPKLENTATQIHVKKVVDFDKIVAINPSCSTGRFNMDSLVNEALQEKKIKVPISFIFLRDFYYQHDEITYAKKEEIKILADKLKISSTNFQEFCKVFTLFGSIIDVSLIDQKSEYIIMKPNLFVKELDKIFHTTDPVLADTGILTQSAAEEIFGDTANAGAYMDIFVSLSLAVRLTHDQAQISLTHDQVEISPPLNVNGKTVLYLPDIRTTQPIEDSSELRPNVLRLIRSLNAPPDHLQVTFVTEFLKLNPDSSVCIQENVPNNITVIKAFNPTNHTSIEFTVVYFGHTLEFRCKTANEQIFTEIIMCCHKVMDYKYHEKTKYNFAILCSNEPISKRDYHYLPDRSLCERCQTDKRLQDSICNLWNDIVEVSRLIVCI